MNRKHHLNATICRHITSHGYTCLVQSEQVYMLVPFVLASGFTGHQIIKINSIAHAYKVMGY